MNRTYFRFKDYSWWVWLVIATCLLVGLTVDRIGVLIALALSALQAIASWAQHRSVVAFPAQLRIAYVLVLCIGLIPGLQGLLWIPAIGTFALCFFGYCLLARCLSLLPWNREGPLSLREAIRTFTVPPDPRGTDAAAKASGCPGGVCSLDVQLARMRSRTP